MMASILRVEAAIAYPHRDGMNHYNCSKTARPEIGMMPPDRTS